MTAPAHANLNSRPTDSLSATDHLVVGERSNPPLSPWPAPRALTWIEWTVLVGTILVASWLRLHDLDYNTAFNDESINVLIGQSVIDGRLTPSPIPWNFGWYLFPLMAWGADQLGGLTGMRVMAGILGLFTIGAIGWTARRAFGTRTAIVSVVLIAGLSPFIHATRVAFRDAGTLFFLSVGIACFLQAWITNRRAMWMLSALSVFAAFLCKHPLGIYAPPLMILAWMAGANGRRWFALTLLGMLVAYGVYYLPEMRAMWGWLQNLPSLKAPNDALQTIYLDQRLDVWALLLLAGIGFLLDRHTQRGLRLLLIAGGMLFAAIHVGQRTDYLTYKQAAYVLMLLAPVSAHGLVLLSERLLRDRKPSDLTNLREVSVLTTSVLLALPLSVAGREWTFDRADIGVRWQSNALAVEYLLAWASPTRLVLVDDQTLRYALSPTYRTEQFVDAFYYQYGSLRGAEAYAAAVRDGVFDFIVFDGNGFGESATLRAAIAPVLSGRYALAIASSDSVSGIPLEIYRRVQPAVTAPATPRTRLRILSPTTGMLVDSGVVVVRGQVLNPKRLEQVGIEVFTNRWWPQGDLVPVHPVTGAFSVPTALGGDGAQRCHHLIRVSIYGIGRGLHERVTIADVRRSDPTAADARCENM